jgi:restriction system protein
MLDGDWSSDVCSSDLAAADMSIAQQAGVVYRFACEMKPGDLVVYPCKADRSVNIGRISGPVTYEPERNADYPNTRKVEWLKHAAREDFSQAALYEIGSFITLFTVSQNVDEFLAVLEGKPYERPEQPAAVVENDTTVTKTVSKQAEETVRDFIIRWLKKEISAYQFEEFVAHLLECMGYRTRVTEKSGDGGVDVIAHKDLLGFEPPIIKVQCKQTTDAISRPTVTELMGNVLHNESGLFVTLGSFTKDARAYDRSTANLRLIGGDELVELIFAHYTKFSPRYQALLPLKQIYVPALGDEGME